MSNSSFSSSTRSMSFNESNSACANIVTGIELPPWTMDLMRDEEQRQQLYLSTPRSSFSSPNSHCDDKSLATFVPIHPEASLSTESPLEQTPPLGACIKKRQSHNKIERKYRMNINAKIARLQSLVPWMADGDVAFKTCDTRMRRNIELAQTSGKRLNKSTILDMVIEYIIQLKEENKSLSEKVLANEDTQRTSNVVLKSELTDEFPDFDF